MDQNSNVSARINYLRPLWVAMGFSVGFEVFIFIVFGLILYPEGSILDKLIWTVFYCGIGMGATIGTWIDIVIVDRWDGTKAIIATIIITIIFLTACDLLCLRLDHKFQYFGAHKNPYLFFISGLVMTVIGGFLGGILLFTSRGKKLLSNLGL